VSDEELGKDISCTTSIHTGRFVTGARLVAESLYRRFTTPRGTLRGGEAEQNFGDDLTSYIGSVKTKDDAAALPGRIKNEAMKDERLLSCSVVVKRTTDGPFEAFDVTISGTTNAGPFSLAVKVTEVTVALLGIKAEG